MTHQQKSQLRRACDEMNPTAPNLLASHHARTNSIYAAERAFQHLPKHRFGCDSHNGNLYPFSIQLLLFQFHVEDDEARAYFTKILWEVIWKGKVYFLPAALLQLSVLEWSAAFSLLIKFLRCLRKLGPFNEGGDREKSCLALKDRTLVGNEKEKSVLHQLAFGLHRWPSHFLLKSELARPSS